MKQKTTGEAVAVIVLLFVLWLIVAPLIFGRPEVRPIFKQYHVAAIVPQVRTLLPTHIAYQVFGSSSQSTSKILRAQSGQTITIRYVATVYQGLFDVDLYPAAAFFPSAIHVGSISQTGSGQFQIVAPQTSPYEVWVSLWGFEGDYDVSWEVH